MGACGSEFGKVEVRNLLTMTKAWRLVSRCQPAPQKSIMNSPWAYECVTLGVLRGKYGARRHLENREVKARKAQVLVNSTVRGEGTVTLTVPRILDALSPISSSGGTSISGTACAKRTTPPSEPFFRPRPEPPARTRVPLLHPHFPTTPSTASLVPSSGIPKCSEEGLQRAEVAARAARGRRGRTERLDPS